MWSLLRKTSSSSVNIGHALTFGLTYSLGIEVCPDLPHACCREMWRLAGKRLAKRAVPVNCRTPSVESTRLTGREKLEWAGFIALITVIPIGIQLWQFYMTSAVVVNKEVAAELARRRPAETTTAPDGRTKIQRDSTL